MGEAMLAVCSYATKTCDYSHSMSVKKSMTGFTAYKHKENSIICASTPFGSGSERNAFKCIHFETSPADVALKFDTL